MLSVGRVYLAEVVGQLVLVAIVILALYSFHRHYRRPYLLNWARSWVALAIYILVAVASARLARMGLVGPVGLLGLGFVSMVAGYLHIVWLLLGVILVLWKTIKLKEKSIAYMTLVAFALILFAVVGTSVFCGTRHNFGGSDVEAGDTAD